MQTPSSQPARASQQQRKRQRQADQHFAEAFPDLTNPKCPPLLHHASDDELEFRHGGWKKRRELTRAAGVLAGWSQRELDAFDNCGANAWVERYTDEEGGYHVVCQKCKSRYCQPCGKARALMVAENLKEKIGDEKYLHVVLTLCHQQRPMKEEIDRLYASFKTLRSKRLWKQSIDGGAAFFQTHICADGMWHHHLHIVARGAWIHKDSLSTLWHSITGDSTNVGVSRVNGSQKVVREVTRYVSRPADEDTIADPDVLAEMMKALKGRHLCFTFGRWRKFRLTALPTTPRRPSVPFARVEDLIHRARRGELLAGKVLDILQTRSCQTRPPPEDDHYFCD